MPGRGRGWSQRSNALRPVPPRPPAPAASTRPFSLPCGKCRGTNSCPTDVRDAAYENRPLPIGYGQTISQPYIVALMTDLAGPDKDDVVLEIGTGSGYQAAVLSRLVDRVYSIEIVEPLAKQARRSGWAQLGYDNITVRQGDGYYGWPEHAPFDAILVTAAASHIPPPLVGQLKPGGRMVIPVGAGLHGPEPDAGRKGRARSSVHTRVLLPVSFVPLTGAAAAEPWRSWPPSASWLARPSPTRSC